MEKTAVEILDMFAVLAPHIKHIVAEDIGISVIKDGFYTNYVPARTLNLGNNIGDPVKGVVSKACLASGNQIVKVVSREASSYGIPYIACAYPLKDNGLVMGCVTTTQTLDVYDKVNTIMASLEASANQFGLSMQKMVDDTRDLSGIINCLKDLGAQMDQAVNRVMKLLPLFAMWRVRPTCWDSTLPLRLLG